jgi:hypothetical protein
MIFSAAVHFGKKSAYYRRKAVSAGFTLVRQMEQAAISDA